MRCKTHADIILPIQEIVLHPFGPKKGAVKPQTIKSESKHGFSCIDLLWKAHNAESIHIRVEQPNGVGIYRLGHERKMPAYFIGNYYDNGCVRVEE